MNITKGKMKTFIVIVAGIAALLFLPTAAQASSDTSVSSLQKQVADAQKKVTQAQADLDQAKEKAESGMSSSDKSAWRPAEAKFESMVAAGKDSDKISDQRDTLRELESHAMKSSDREKVDDARSELVGAYATLNQAKTQLHATQQRNNDDSSQFTQPENRTQNGSNFSIRSQRDSENHPPLPTSQ
jgi:hypothetical protein